MIVYTARELSAADEQRLRGYSSSLVVKRAKLLWRLLWHRTASASASTLVKLLVELRGGVIELQRSAPSEGSASELRQPAFRSISGTGPVFKVRRGGTTEIGNPDLTTTFGGG